MQNRFFIAGGTGFLGKPLVKRLAEQGCTLNVLARPGSNTEGLEHENIALCRGDVTDSASVENALDGCTRAYYMAACVKEWARDKSIFDKVNSAALDSFLTAAQKKGLEKIVYTSSFIALGPSDRRGECNEDSVHEPGHFHNDYERTKFEASAIVEKHRRAGLNIVTAVPGVIYGPGELTDGNIVVKIMRQFLRGRLPGIPGRGERKWSYAFIDDVVAGHIACMEKGAPGGNYILGGDNRSSNEFFSILADLSGQTFPKRYIPLWLLWCAGLGLEVLARLGGPYPLITRGIVGVYGHDWAYSSARAHEELGYTPRPLEEGLKITYEWLRNAGSRVPG